MHENVNNNNFSTFQPFNFSTYRQEARAIDDHRVAVVFRKGRKGIFDCRPYFGIGYYRKLNNPEFFKCAFVSCGDLAWPGDIDIGADDVWDEAKKI